MRFPSFTDSVLLPYTKDIPFDAIESFFYDRPAVGKPYIRADEQHLSKTTLTLYFAALLSSGRVVPSFRAARKATQPKPTRTLAAALALLSMPAQQKPQKDGA